MWSCDMPPVGSRLRPHLVIATDVAAGRRADTGQLRARAPDSSGRNRSGTDRFLAATHGAGYREEDCQTKIKKKRAFHGSFE